MKLYKEHALTMLIVDDYDPNSALKYFKAEILKHFPSAQVTIATGILETETLIRETAYNVIFLDANLKNWGDHPVFKKYGGNIIPFIKNISSDTFIVAISSDDDYNEEMIKRGADISFKDFKKEYYI